MALNTSTADKHAKDVLGQISWKPVLMSSHLLTTQPPMRPCTQCKRLMPTTQKLKTCDKCRRKDREKSIRKAAMRKAVSDEGKKRAELRDMDVDEPEEEGGIEGELWNQMRKRIKMEFEDAKRKGKVLAVKNTESKVRSSPHLNSNIYFIYYRNALPHPTKTQHPTNLNPSSSPPFPLNRYTNPYYSTQHTQSYPPRNLLSALENAWRWLHGKLGRHLGILGWVGLCLSEFFSASYFTPLPHSSLSSF